MLRDWLRAVTPLEPTLRQKPLPERLAKQLRRIPDQEILCRDLDGRWTEWNAGEPEGIEGRKVGDHLAACERCRSLWAVLVAARPEPALLPVQLRARLRGVSTPRRRAPWWLSDVRFALAASYLLALCVTFGAAAAGETPAAGESSGKALVRSVTVVGGEVVGRARQAVAASSRLGSELQRVVEELFSSSSERNPEEMIPAGDPRPSNEERR